MRSIVVVGGSLAGLRAAEELRLLGYDGRLTVVGDEPHRPYDRPPLSKQLLAGKWEPDQIALTVQGDEGIDGLDVDWRLGVRASGLDLAGRSLTLGAGDETGTLGFDGLVIATGATPRTLPTGGLDGIHTLRTLDDCLAIRAVLDATPRRVVVVGAGFIGAEVAATCRERGLDVTLLEALPVPMERAIGGEIGALTCDVHRDHGVDVRLGVGVDRFDGGARVERVHLADGSAIEADVVVVGVGVAPNTGWLEGSGLELDNGVVCDATTLAAPGVVAAGDVARWPSARLEGPLRVEHWENAVQMGEHAARRLLDDEAPMPYDPVPWFWSDQYDRKIQLSGFAAGADEMQVVDGSLAERRFAAIYRRGDRVVGVLAMNRPRQVVTYRPLVERGAPWAEALALATTG
ncbi:MAG TPA: FAD-dependent oxidoreductase [Acidimicrobiales bacterium]|nr:FAD-dependent oxidoreductase [Acidimicrobiales bacterium]